MEWFPSWAIWLILGFILLILEIFIPGVFIMWWGGAAIIISIVIALFPSISLVWQLILFAIFAVIFSMIWWKYQHSKDSIEDRENTLNARKQAMIGSQGIITEVLENGIARGKFGDTTWRVIGENLNYGDKVQIEKVDGITLFVSKL